MAEGGPKEGRLNAEKGFLMALKLVTFQLAAPERCSRFSQQIRKLGHATRLTDTSYVLDSTLDTAGVLKKLMIAADLDDDVYVLELSSSWSGYGTESANQFLEAHLQGMNLSA